MQTCQFLWEIIRTVNMVQVPEGMAVSSQGQRYVQSNEGHADQRRSFKISSG